MLQFIETKRNGQAHSAGELCWFINHLDQIPDYQVSAWLMAVCINGMTKIEVVELTRAMAYSGHVLTLKRDLGGACDHDHLSCNHNHSLSFVDKHSTGGVGDKVTIILLPILASLGFRISKFSGRSLGHTGGTIDKLESIPGFSTQISMKAFEKQIQDCGIALSSQSLEFTPADKRLYDLRDKSNTVESLPLIASSVMSKKIAGGADHVLLDVKLGSGAFMKDLAYAKELAKLMIHIGKTVNLNTRAIISNMDQPLGFSVGNSLEVLEAKEFLEGKFSPDIYDLILDFASFLAPRSKVEEVIKSGKAYVKLEEWVSAQGGDLNSIASANKAKFIFEQKASIDSWIKSLDALEVGKAIHELAYKNSKIDNIAGVYFKAKTGDKVKAGDILFSIQGQNEDDLVAAQAKILSAYQFSNSKIHKPKTVLTKF